MDRSALNNALERRCGHRFAAVDVCHKVRQILVDKFVQRGAQFVHIDAARLHDAFGVGFIHQRQQQMLQRCEFVATLVCQRQRGMDCFFQCRRE